MKVGMIGAGGFGGGVLLPGLKLAKECELVAVCDRDEGVARRAADKFGIPNVFTDSEELMNSTAKFGGLDLVVVGTPPAAHEAIVNSALDRGLHVFCEKPLTMTSTGAQALAAKAEKLGLVNAVDHELRYATAYRTLRSLVASGYVGKIRQLNVSMAANFGINPHFEPTYYWNFGSLLSGNGGIMAQMLCHIIDLVVYIARDVEPLGGYAATLIPEKPTLLPPLEPGGPKRAGPMKPVDADDSVILVGVLPDLAPATISANWVTPNGPGTRWEIWGSEGYLVYQADDIMYGGKIIGRRHDDPAEQVLPFEADFLAEHPNGSPGYGHAMIAHTAHELAAAIAGQPGERRYATFASEVGVWQRMDRWRELFEIRRATPESAA